MTSRQRLITTLSGQIPDCVPVAPDFSNMIPARLTGKPFWDLYLYNDPPIWNAYVDCAKRFNIDSVMDGYFPLTFVEDQPAPDPTRQRFIVRKDERMIITQWSWLENGVRRWNDKVDVYYVADPPTGNVVPSKVQQPETPTWYEPLEGVKPVDRGPAGFAEVTRRLGDQGLQGAWLAWTAAFRNEEEIYNYYDHPELHAKWAQDRVEAVDRRMQLILKMPVKPDFLCVGGSGTLVYQTVEMFRKVVFPAVKHAIELAKKHGFMTHIHSCGPEAQLVKIMAEETDLTVIDPLEIPPMGDCNLRELKKKYGHKITLKGNLHTTNVMLKGSVDDVIRASKQAIDDGAAGGRFILSTGDQCGRDTPDANIHAMVETARTYGRYEK
jgi:uroporphyrinogen decarboxylase